MIRRYRTLADLTQQALGDRISVTRQTIAAWENGDRSPSLLQLSELARALGIPADLLLASGDADEGHTLLFRADRPDILSPQLRALLSRRAEDYATLERLVGETPALPASRPLQGYDPFTIERAAGEVRDWLGVEDAPLGDALALLEAKGLKILRHGLPSEVSGFSAYTEGWGGVIVVNAVHPPERQYFTALHELGHLIFHRREYDGPTQSVGRGDPREKAAHHLAAAVLLPRAALEQELHAYRGSWLPEPLLVDLKRRYGVSIRTIVLRAADLAVITRKQMGQQIGLITREYGRAGEPGEVRAPENLGRLERLVWSALRNEKITTSRAAEILQRPLMEIRRELADWLAPKVEGAGA